MPKQCIDTGMGFERLCMILAGKTSIFETDLYQSDHRGASRRSAHRVLRKTEQAVHQRIIADHARACVFLVADGVVPSNTDRGYVLRFLARRAIRSGTLLGFPEGFFSKLTPVVIASLISGYPELGGADERVRGVLEAEEKQFSATLARGSARLAERIEALRRAGAGELPGTDAFELYDTYGFPLDLTREIASEAGLSIDMAGYHAAMEEQRERARADAHRQTAAKCAWRGRHRATCRTIDIRRIRPALRRRRRSSRSSIAPARPSSAWRRAPRASWSSIRRRFTRSAVVKPGDRGRAGRHRSGVRRARHAI